ncbi:hypothetical protein Ctaglu_45360 [Clostridium tagluense]|uniref:Uncharacterized protein n=1 Tax=Clostridium tagluense TaxID=360422 RepID=A0A401UTP2_9CLOT|nr:hypothetical protein Ctaglu_45360 [Clostridium tagluense]
MEQIIDNIKNEIKKLNHDDDIATLSLSKHDLRMIRYSLLMYNVIIEKSFKILEGD